MKSFKWLKKWLCPCIKAQEDQEQEEEEQLVQSVDIGSDGAYEVQNQKEIMTTEVNRKSEEVTGTNISNIEKEIKLTEIDIFNNDIYSVIFEEVMEKETNWSEIDLVNNDINNIFEAHVEETKVLNEIDLMKNDIYSVMYDIDIEREAVMNEVGLFENVKAKIDSKVEVSTPMHKKNFVLISDALVETGVSNKNKPKSQSLSVSGILAENILLTAGKEALTFSNEPIVFELSSNKRENVNKSIQKSNENKSEEQKKDVDSFKNKNTIKISSEIDILDHHIINIGNKFNKEDLVSPFRKTKSLLSISSPTKTASFPVKKSYQQENRTEYAQNFFSYISKKEISKEKSYIIIKNYSLPKIDSQTEGELEDTNEDDSECEKIAEIENTLPVSKYVENSDGDIDVKMADIATSEKVKEENYIFEHAEQFIEQECSDTLDSVPAVKKKNSNKSDTENASTDKWTGLPNHADPAILIPLQILSSDVHTVVTEIEKPVEKDIDKKFQDNANMPKYAKEKNFKKKYPVKKRCSWPKPSNKNYLSYYIHQEDWKPTRPLRPIEALLASPGPAIVNLPTTIGVKNHDPTKKRAPSYSIGQRLSPRKPFIESGPSTRNNNAKIDEEIKRTSKLETSNRFANTISNRFPSSTTYNINFKKKYNYPPAPRISMTRSQKDKAIIKTTPAPNAYSLPPTLGPGKTPFVTGPTLSIRKGKITPYFKIDQNTVQVASLKQSSNLHIARDSAFNNQTKSAPFTLVKSSPSHKTYNIPMVKCDKYRKPRCTFGIRHSSFKALPKFDAAE